MLQYLREHPTRAFKAKELQRALGVGHSQYRGLRALLGELAGEGRIVALPRRRYGMPAAARALEGVVEGVGQRATHVRLEDGTRSPLHPRSIESCVPGDRVRVSRVREGRELLLQVERIVRAARRRVFGELLRAGSRWVLVPERPIPGVAGGLYVEDPVEAPAPEDEGRLAQGWIAAYDPATEKPRLESLEVLGETDHPQAAMALRIARAGWPTGFSAEAETQARQTPPIPLPRRDRCGAFVFTIDPLEAKDHDDAVCVERLDDGSTVLEVHIADVASRVPAGGALDDEARVRATSVYPPGQVLPMLPEILSSGVCSLHHGVERETMCVRLHYAPDGRRKAIAVGLARIRSRASLSYEHAEALLEGSQTALPPERVEDGLDSRALRSAVVAMHTLAARLRERRRDLGSLFVQRPEREFRFGPDGHVAEVRIRPHLRTHWIIEEFMLEANRAVAEVLHQAELPLLWRIHEPPDEKKVDELAELLQTFGVRWVPSRPVGSADYAHLFALVEGRPQAPLIHLLALRSLMKARYHAGWDRHFGLGFDQYTHFTSPIRRYPDLHNQRWLHRLIAAAGEEGWIEHAPAVARQIAAARLARPADLEDAQRLADQCSSQEREAVRLERACADICAADALKPREGEVLDGMIVSVLRSGVFVELDGTGLDGFVAIDRLGREWFHHDPVRHQLRGERTGRRFGLGQRVRVLLEYVDVANGRTWLGDLRPVGRE